MNEQYILNLIDMSASNLKKSLPPSNFQMFFLGLFIFPQSFYIFWNLMMPGKLLRYLTAAKIDPFQAADLRKNTLRRLQFIKHQNQTIWKVVSLISLLQVKLREEK